MLIGHGKDMPSTDFGFTIIKVKVTRITKNVLLVFAHYLENYL